MNFSHDRKLDELAPKIEAGERLTFEEGVTLFRTDDLSRLNAAFFTTNAFVSVILLATFGGAALWK